MKTELELLREMIEKIVKEGEVIDIGGYRRGKQTQELESAVELLRECMTDTYDQLLHIEALLEGTPHEETFKTLRDTFWRGQDTQTLNAFLQEIINNSR
jgi:hypothetical protein